ncbi:MAG TPA: UDP-N-acetylmuramyl pentapeptide phosphotransferase, partial [Rhodospirillaceae bacterium]|nr:UDP-N-acetylmuramyl pentapeptide phosphotransferase [Rhodospirillaceae bacterium]
SLGIAIRLGAQFFAAVIGLAFLQHEGLLLQGLAPEWLDRAVTVLAWVWFVNLFNFMDGIDGIAAVETIIVAGGLAVLALIVPARAPDIWFPLSLIAATLGFLWWNWHPAKLFLGDVGSVPLGFLLGGLLILTAMKGAWLAALILPLYFLADATLTLFLRALKREPVWQAHRQHCYQQAVQNGKSHAAVSIAVGLIGLVLICLGAFSIYQPVLSFAGATALVAGLMVWMVR